MGNRTATDKRPTNETPVNNNNNESRNENTNPQGISGQGMSSSEPSEQSASERTTNEQSGQSEHSNVMDDENGKLLELLQPKPNQIHNTKTITSTVRTEYSDAEKNQRAPNQQGGTTIRPATTVPQKTKEQGKNVQESKGLWCKYDCLTNGFCKVKWGGAGKNGGGTCLPLSYKNGECHKGVPSKCRDRHEVL